MWLHPWRHTIFFLFLFTFCYFFSLFSCPKFDYPTLRVCLAEPSPLRRNSFVKHHIHVGSVLGRNLEIIGLNKNGSSYILSPKIPHTLFAWVTRSLGNFPTCAMFTRFQGCQTLHLRVSDLVSPPDPCSGRHQCRKQESTKGTRSACSGNFF